MIIKRSESVSWLTSKQAQIALRGKSLIWKAQRADMRQHILAKEYESMPYSHTAIDETAIYAKIRKHCAHEF